MSRFLVGATWADSPHLTEDAQRTLESSIPAYQRDARTRGIPQLGSGAIYPIEESRLLVQPFAIPSHWKRGFGMDCGGGSKPTAWAGSALNPENDTLYVTDVYKHAAPEPSQHAAAIKRKMGDWSWPGVGDAAALIMTQHDTEQLVYVYRRLGLDLNLPDKSVETGLKEVYDRMVADRFKVFATCAAWFQEFRLYQRDKHGRIKKANDHLMDATRYLVRSGVARMKCKPVKDDEKPAVIYIDQGSSGGLGWMGS